MLQLAVSLSLRVVSQLERRMYCNLNRPVNRVRKKTQVKSPRSEINPNLKLYVTYVHDDDYHYCIIDEDNCAVDDSHMQLLYYHAEQHELQL
jgi:uncharacterized protein YpmS